ncbi:hypothetical protein [Streptomyces anulatus]|uniref:hypothetical protein n=1 Tax=Streptomyces anulatus TaxID=1892 RepID=UPI0036A20DC5
MAPTPQAPAAEPAGSDLPDPAAMDQAIAAFQAANAHIRDGCTTCSPAARLPDMCVEGQTLALAAVATLAH